MQDSNGSNELTRTVSLYSLLASSRAFLFSFSINLQTHESCVTRYKTESPHLRTRLSGASFNSYLSTQENSFAETKLSQ